MLNFRGDLPEEMRHSFSDLQETLGTNSQQLLERLQIILNMANTLDNSQTALRGDTQEIARQIVNLNSSFTTSFNELGKFVEVSVNNLTEHSKKIEDRLREHEQRAEIETVRAKVETAQFEQSLTVLQSTLLARLEHLDDWKRTLPPDAIEDEVAWLGRINADLRRLGLSQQLHGNARMFVVQLAKNLRALQKLSGEIATRDTAYFTEKATVQELDRTLFRPHSGVQWVDIGDDEYGEAGLKSRARAELRALETAILNYRRRLQQQLKQRHDFASIPIVLHQTIFDPTLHETTEMYSMPTLERAKDNRIIGIERNGYQCAGAVLERAFVRRFLWDESASTDETNVREIDADSNDVDAADVVEIETEIATNNGDEPSEEERERLLDAAMNK